MALRSYSRDGPYCDQRSRVRTLSRRPCHLAQSAMRTPSTTRQSPDLGPARRTRQAQGLRRPGGFQTIGVIGRRCHRPATARAPPVGFDTRLGLSPRDRSGHRDYERRASRFHGGVVQPQRPPPSPPRTHVHYLLQRREAFVTALSPFYVAHVRDIENETDQLSASSAHL